MAKSEGKRPFLDHVECYLARRDGVDKALKIIRYSTKLLLTSPIAPSNPELFGKLKDFEASVGTSRKAFRLGKFIQDVNVLKKTKFCTRDGILEVVASGGEGFYFFVEQFIWLVSEQFYLVFLNLSFSIASLAISWSKKEEEMRWWLWCCHWAVNYGELWCWCFIFELV